MDQPIFRLRQNLASLLKHRAMTAAELSRATGIAKQVLSDWMAGVQPRKLEQLYLVSKTLGVSMEQLCFADSIETMIQDKKSTDAGAASDNLHHIKGRYEVYLRRILDDDETAT